MPTRYAASEDHLRRLQADYMRLQALYEFERQRRIEAEVDALELELALEFAKRNNDYLLRQVETVRRYL